GVEAVSPFALTWSPDGQLLAVAQPARAAGQETYEVRLFDASSAEELGVFPEAERVFHLQFADDSSILVAGHSGTAASAWDVTKRPPRPLPPPPPAMWCDLRGKLLAGRDADAVYVWDLAAGRAKARLPVAAGANSPLAVLAPDGQTVAAETYRTGPGALGQILGSFGVAVADEDH